jgi:DNA-binding HxlR family transcriptional regulator
MKSDLFQEGTVLKHSNKNVSGNCMAVHEVLSQIGDKWTVLIVRALNDGPRRFSELRRDVEGISQRMLTLNLKTLERDGFVTRTVYATIPPRVDYELTTLGHSLSDPLGVIAQWAITNRQHIVDARIAFDAREPNEGPVRVAAE